MGISNEATNIGQHLHTAQRAAEVAAALTKFGFGEMLRAGGLEKYLVGHKKNAEEDAIAKRPLPERVRMLLESLGPTFVKVGQILSTRTDLVGPEWVLELRKLQSEVPPIAWDGDKGIRAQLEKEYGCTLDELFESIEEEPLAAASMAQVHRAVARARGEGEAARGPEPVVLKVLRPGIRDRLTSDVELMRLFAKLTRSHFEDSGLDPEAIIDEFAIQLERETDLTIEANSTDRMRNDFADHEGVSFPKVFRDLSTRGVLALEEVHGTLLTHLDIEGASREQRETIVRNGADAVFRQCLEIGFFHADPHPGNIFVLEGERLCFIDCGMTGMIDPGTLEQLAHIVHGAIEGKLDRVVRAAVRLAEAPVSKVDDRAFRADVWRYISRFNAVGDGTVQMGAMLGEFFTILQTHQMRAPADIVYLVKSLATIEGAANDIAPWFDLIGHVRPYVERLVKKRYGIGALKDRFEGAVTEYADLIEDLPHHAGSVLRQIRHNDLSLNLHHKGLDKMTTEVERASLNIAWAVVVASIIVGSSVLLLADAIDRDTSLLTWVALTAFVGGLGLGMVRLIWSKWIGT